MKYTYKSVDALIKAFQGGELYGYAPSESYDATKFAYPIEVETDEEAKTFKVTESVKTAQKNETLNVLLNESKKVPFYKKGWFWFCVVAAIIVIIGICLAVKG